MQNHHLLNHMYKWRSYEENYKHMVDRKQLQADRRGERGIIPILFPLFGIPLLIYSHHSSKVICEILVE